MTTAPATVPPRAPRVSRAALEQRLRRLLRRRPPAAHRIVLVRAEPTWDGDRVLVIDGIDVEIVPCVSPLAVLEQVAGSSPPAPRLLVLLTDRDDRELGDGILSQVYRHQVHTVEPWALVEESFGAGRLDSWLTSEKWAARALLDAMPAEGWPRLTGPVLTRDHALRHLAARRLGLDPAEIDLASLLRWSADPNAAPALAAVGDDERRGLLQWLTETCGAAAGVLFAVVDAGYGPQALSVGLACGCLWDREAPREAAERARGRADRFFGGRMLSDDAVQSFAKACYDVVVTMAAEHGGLHAGWGASAHPVPILLDHADYLLNSLDAAAAGRGSDLLPSGFTHRLEAVALALTAALDSRERSAGAATVAEAGPAAAAAAGRAVTALRGHRLAGQYRQRVEPAEMALRLLRWLGSESAAAPATAAAAVAAHMAEWSWVDVAADHVWAGEDRQSTLQASYRRLYQAVATRRRALDETFAGRLADVTSAGVVPDGLLVVEDLLAKVVAPLVARDRRPTLLVVLDGMSAAVAVQLAEDMRRHHWDEYDPLGVTRTGNGPRRRAALAALPTTTAVSRTSLLAGRLVQGWRDDETAAFTTHRMWRGATVRLFHRNGLRGGPGAALSDDLTAAIEGDDPLVALVVNTVDDSLDSGREGMGLAWRTSGTGLLRVVLDHARSRGRAVVVTSDHGYVHDHGGELAPAAVPSSARHRPPGGELGPGEIELSGPRVLAPDHRIVALWDAGLRYTARRAGYHGGASAAEATVPVLTFLPFPPTMEEHPPRGWRPLSDQRPAWWSLATAVPPTEPEPTAVLGGVPPKGFQAGRREPLHQTEAYDGQSALDFGLAPTFEAAASSQESGSRGATETLVPEVLATEMFEAQHGLTPRRVPKPKIAAALGALVEANGVLPVGVVAEQAGEQPGRAVGFATTLQRILNVDNYPVLSLVDDGRTLRLDIGLLREQFGLRGLVTTTEMTDVERNGWTE